MSNKTKAELEQDLQDVGEKLVAVEKRNADLLGQLKAFDEGRPEPTLEEERVQREALEAKDAEIEELGHALAAAQSTADKLQATLNDADEMRDLVDAMSEQDAMDLAPIVGLCGKLPVTGNLLVTTGVDLEGGGVVLVAQSEGALAFSFAERLKLSRKPAGMTLQKRPEFR